MGRRVGTTMRWGGVAALGLLVAGLVVAEPAAAGTVQSGGVRSGGGYGLVQAPGYAPADPRAGAYGSVPATGWTVERRWRDHDRDGDRDRWRRDGWRHDGWRDHRWGHDPDRRPGWHRPYYGGGWGPRPIYRPGQWIWNGWGWIWVPY